MSVLIIHQPDPPAQAFDYALSIALDLAAYELDYHSDQARRALDEAEYHIVMAQLADERLQRLQVQIPERCL